MAIIPIIINVLRNPVTWILLVVIFFSSYLYIMKSNYEQVVQENERLSSQISQLTSSLSSTKKDIEVGSKILKDASSTITKYRKKKVKLVDDYKYEKNLKEIIVKLQRLADEIYEAANHIYDDS